MAITKLITCRFFLPFMGFVANLSKVGLRLRGGRDWLPKLIMIMQSPNWFHVCIRMLIAKIVNKFISENVHNFKTSPISKKSLPFSRFTWLQNACKKIYKLLTFKNCRYALTHAVFLFLLRPSGPAYMHDYQFYFILCTRVFPRLAKTGEFLKKVDAPLASWSFHECWSTRVRYDTPGR